MSNKQIDFLRSANGSPLIENFFFIPDRTESYLLEIFSTEFTFLDRFFLKRFRLRLFILGIRIFYVSFFFHALKRKIYNLRRIFWSCLYSV